MNNKLVIGMCIIFALVATTAYAQLSVEIATEGLLANYDNEYSDGTTSITYTSSSNLAAGVNEAGTVSHTFSLVGSGTYDIVAVMNQPDFKKTSIEKTGVTSGAFIVDFDGNYLTCGADSLVDIRAYQNGVFKYEKTYTTTFNCDTNPIKLNCYTDLSDFPPTIHLCYTQGGAYNTNMQGLLKVGNDLQMKFELLFAEAGSYTVGAYIGDGKGAFAYAEQSVSASSGANQVTLIYPANKIKHFKLINEKARVQSILVDGKYVHMTQNSLSPEYYIMAYEYEYPAQNITTPSDFTITDVTLNNVTFDTSQIDGNGKITQLGLNVLLNNYAGPYNAEISLENIYGEFIDSKTFTINGATTPVWFNGTDIYNSKVNGPYRAGFVRVWQGATEYIYDLAIGQSADLAYTNFTSGTLSDLKTSSADIAGTGPSATVTVTNLGSADAIGVTISLFDSASQKIEEFIVDVLQAGQPVVRTLGAAASVILDFNNNVEETDETNNVATRNLTSAPVFTSTPGATVLVGSLYVYDADATGSTPITYALVSAPAGMTINPSTGIISWTPVVTGTFSVTVSATNSYGVVNQAYSIIVVPASTAPIFTSTPILTATQGVSYSYTATATDPNAGDNLTFGLTTSPTGMGINPTTGLVTWTPSNTDYGIGLVNISVTDGTYNTNQVFTVEITTNTFTLKLATLDRASNTFINSTIVVGSDTKNSTDAGEFQNFTINSDTVYGITHSSPGYTTDVDPNYFDRRLTSCTTGQGCTFAGTYTTICVWQTNSTAGIQIPVSNSWYCSIEGPSLQKDWYRYVDGTERYIRRFNYLVP